MLKGNKGQLIIYFLVACTMIAVVAASVMQYRMQIINRQMRLMYISELKAECDGNVAQCRVISANEEIYRQENEGFTEPAHIRTKATRNFIKVSLVQFKYSSQARLQWQGFVNKLNEYGLLKEEKPFVDVPPQDCKDLYDVYYNMFLFLVKAQANNCNFDF